MRDLRPCRMTWLLSVCRNVSSETLVARVRCSKQKHVHIAAVVARDFLNFSDIFKGLIEQDSEMAAFPWRYIVRPKRVSPVVIIFPRIRYYDVQNVSTLVVVIIKFRVLWCLDFTSAELQVACCKAPFFIFWIYIFAILSSSLLINLSMTCPCCVEKKWVCFHYTYFFYLAFLFVHLEG